MIEDGHNYSFGPPAGGWPSFKGGKVIRLSSTSAEAECEGEWEWCKGRNPLRRGSELVCRAAEVGVESCEKRCEWEDGRAHCD